MMSDLISRQDAIDMFQNLAYDDWNQGVSTTWANAFSESAEMIRDLPSAQPEIIRCKDCKWSYDAIGRTFCSRGCCVDCEVDIDFFCADGERKNGDANAD